MFDGFRLNCEDIIQDVALGNVAGLFGSSPCGEDFINRGGEGMSEYFGVGVGSGKGSGFIGGASGTFWVVEVRFGKEPKKRIVEVCR